MKLLYQSCKRVYNSIMTLESKETPSTRLKKGHHDFIIEDPTYNTRTSGRVGSRGQLLTMRVESMEVLRKLDPEAALRYSHSIHEYFSSGLDNGGTIYRHDKGTEIGYFDTDFKTAQANLREVLELLSDSLTEDQLIAIARRELGHLDMPGQRMQFQEITKEIRDHFKAKEESVQQDQ